ncbi:MAG: Maf family nucleotide pyrophosphatase [Candidatus Omnitrophica bacterium]|nr:Maf family nucleotide pyrophosphatase [Candidatus Omnitrophota bacterium]MDD5355396.1 Maf family nucleotide pyrophosphatase [Candidatus Omnitrophota bacterium]
MSRNNIEIILASRSKARRQILENCGFKVKVVASSARESRNTNCSFSSLVKDNALRKLKDVARRVKTGIIVSADTLVFRKGFVFGKPRNIKDAKAMLKALSRKPHWVYTGVAVLDKEKNKLLLDYEKTKVYMHNLSDGEIARYFSRNNPLHFAGSFDIQGQGGLYIKRIEGCFYNVVGLPLAKLYKMLRKIGVLLFLLTFSFGLSGCTEFNPVTRKQEMILYSTEKEVTIGRNVARQVEEEYELVKNPLVIERLNNIADKISAVADRGDISYHVCAIQAKEEEKEDGSNVNAFALPGGYIYIYDGLIDFVDDDDQLACVIAHEVGHIVAKHSIKKLQASMGYTLLSLATISTGDSDLIAGTNYALTNVLLAYSREDELLADTLGARYAKKAGYNPRAMIDFLEKLREKKKEEPIRAKSLYRTHPYIADRIVAIKKELGEPLTFSDYVNISNE